MTDHVIGLEAADQVTRACVGDRIVVRLPENPTTGYRWVVEDPGAGVLSLEASSFEPPAVSQPGAPGTRTFWFTAVSSGQAGLCLSTRRAAATPATGEVRFSVRVDAAGTAGVPASGDPDRRVER